MYVTYSITHFTHSDSDGLRCTVHIVPLLNICESFTVGHLKRTVLFSSHAGISTSNPVRGMDARMSVPFQDQKGFTL